MVAAFNNVVRTLYQPLPQRFFKHTAYKPYDYDSFSILPAAHLVLPFYFE